MIHSVHHNHRSSGFSLIEVMITLLIASVLMAGLFSEFVSQSKQYRYQDKLLETSQDLEFAIRFIADDLQSALVLPTAKELGGTGVRAIEGLSSGTSPSTFLTFEVWDEDRGSDPDFQVRRCYRFEKGMIKLDMNVASCTSATVISDSAAILGEDVIKTRGLESIRGMQVTNFRVFQDGLAADDASRSNYFSIPAPLPAKVYRNFNNDEFDMPAFTILIELEVDSVSKEPRIDVLGNPVVNNKNRIWRYMQVYPAVVLEQ